MSLFEFIDQTLDSSQPVGNMPPIQNSKKRSVVIPLEAYREEPTTRQRENSSRKGKKSKPEKPSFLKSFLNCRDRPSTGGKNDGFFCTTCQPGIPETPAYANGPDYLQLDIVHVDSHEVKAKENVPEKQYFLAALPWIREHLQELLEAGWTRASLFRRGKYTWPYGFWGVAWLSPWDKENVHVEIDRKNGAIRFTFKSSNGRNITQTAYPPLRRQSK